MEGHSSPSIADDPTKHNPTFASISDLVAYLRKKNEQRILSDRHIDFVADYLCEIGTEKKGLEYTVPGYETVSTLSDSHMTEMVARPLVVMSGPCPVSHSYRPKQRVLSGSVYR